MRFRFGEIHDARAIVFFTFALTFITSLPSSSGADEAKDAFETGIEAFRRDDFHAALAAFERSYNLRPMPKVMFNIAMCQKAIYRYTDALNSFEEFIEISSLSEDDPLYLEVTTEVTDLMTKIGRLEITSNPTGAAVYLNGERLGPTPVTPFPTVDPGTHKLTFEHPGFEPFNQEVTVAAGATTPVYGALKKAQGTVEIRCPPSGTVVIDQKQTGRCPFVGALPVGPHQLTLSAPGAEMVDRVFTIDIGERLLLDLSTLPAATPSATTPPPPPAPISASPKRSNPTMLALGTISLTLSAGAGALGAFFTIQGKNEYNNGIDAIDNGDKGTYDEINGKKLPAYRIGATVSFVSSGVFLATGLTLVLLGTRKNNERPRSIGARIRLDAEGVTLLF